MFIHLKNSKLESIEVSNRDELRMVLEMYGELPASAQAQEVMTYLDNRHQQVPQPPQNLSVKDKLKEIYNDLEERPSHRQVIQILAQTEGHMTSHQLAEILHLDKPHAVAALMTPLSRRAQGKGLEYKDIIDSKSDKTPEGGAVQSYSLSQAMREAMAELGFTPKKANLPLEQNDQLFTNRI